MQVLSVSTTNAETAVSTGNIAVKAISARVSFNAVKKGNAVAVDWKLKTVVTTIPAKVT